LFPLSVPEDVITSARDHSTELLYVFGTFGIIWNGFGSFKLMINGRAGFEENGSHYRLIFFNTYQQQNLG